MTTEQQLKEIQERQRNRSTSKWDGHGRSMIKDIDFLLSLLDSQAAGGDLNVLNEIRQRVADGYESASCRNVITVAALTLKDLHYVLSSHDGQFQRGATAMRSRCVEKVRAKADFFYGKGSASTASALREAADDLEAVTLGRQERQL